MSKVAYHEYQAMLLDPESDEQKILALSRIKKGENHFDWVLEPNPEQVDITERDIAAENAMGTLNDLFRWRRHARFRLRRRLGSTRPVLVSEGDSWFQFPLLIREVIDQLRDDYDVWSVGAAGDVLENMVHGETSSRHAEYMKALVYQKDNVKAFLFSGAGNDIIGEKADVNPPRSALYDITHPFNGDEHDVLGHINNNVLNDRLAYIETAYRKMIEDIHRYPGFEQLPIIIHGYDYVFPYPYGTDDSRNPIYAKNDEWLGEPLKSRNIPTKGLGREIIKVLIDALYERLESIANDPAISNVVVVDCRNAMPDLGDWQDEIHGTSKGFAKVTQRFKAALADIVQL